MSQLESHCCVAMGHRYLTHGGSFMHLLRIGDVRHPQIPQPAGQLKQGDIHRNPIETMVQSGSHDAVVPMRDLIMMPVLSHLNLTTITS